MTAHELQETSDAGLVMAISRYHQDALAEAYRRGADEAVLANTVGELCEGTGSNVLVERAGVLATPPLSSGCLAGITRELAIEWGREAGLEVVEQAMPYDVLDEVLAGSAHLTLSGSIRNVSPVVSLDGAAVAAGGASLELQRLFQVRAADDIDP